MERSHKILIVDDERLNINILADLLKPHYKIMAAINGKQALKAAQSDNPPDLILLDVMMPEMDGYEVCAQLKANPSTRDIPVIFVTAMGQESDEARGLAAGAVDYITKPISPAIVEARIKTHMTLKQKMTELQSAYAIIEAQKERMQKELNIGRDIQLSMLPKEFPAFPNRDEFTIYGSMQAAREVGGDFYDFFFIDEDHLCCCIGDVSGKGVPAALFMAITKSMIRSRAGGDYSTASILTHVNEEIARNNDASMFITIFLGILNVQTGELLYTNAGHNPPYILRENGKTERLDTLHGPVAGVLEGLVYGSDSAVVNMNDMLFLYTDGVTEAMNPDNKLFEEQRLMDLMTSRHYVGPEDLIRATLDGVVKFAAGAEQSDDITLLALQSLKKPSAAAIQSLNIRILNRLEEIDRINAEIEGFTKEHGISGKILMQLKLVFDELLNNIISYGFQDDDEHEIEVKVDLLPKRLLVTITDDGIPFNPFLRETPDLSLSIEEREIGGVGIHLVRNVMDEWSYKRRVVQNVVTLIKHLDKSQK